MTQIQTASVRRSFCTDDAIRLVEAPVRRFAWHLRMSGIVARLAAAGVLLGALASVAWLATSLVAGL